ncbi:MAG: TolC family protein [Kofleriaceae bacterium]
MKLASAVLVAVSFGSPALADDTAPVKQLLTDPGQLATWLRDRDPRIVSSRAKVDAADAATEQARVIQNPVLSFTAGGFVIGQTNNGDGSAGTAAPHLGLADTTNYQIGLTEMIEIGKRGPRKNAADTRAREAGETAVASLGGRIGDVTQLLGKLAYAQAKRDVSAANLADAQQLRGKEKVRLDNKDLSPLEFGRIDLDTQELALQLARAESDLATATAACSAALLAPCATTGLDTTMLDAAAPLPAQIGDVDASIEGRPVRQAGKLEAKALGFDAELASARKIPDPTVGAAYMIDNLTVAGNQHQQFIFSISLPLGLFDTGTHDAAAARANARAIEADDKAQVLEQHGLVAALTQQLQTLQGTLKSLETDQVPKSTQIITQTRKAFDLGEAKLADLIQVERAHRDLLLEVLDTRFDLFNVRAQLRQALGIDDAVARSTSGQRSNP